VRPKTAQDVSRIVNAVVTYPDCKFAVRSSGHTVRNGVSNITDGITIDLGEINQTTYNPESNIDSIGPGARWENTYAELDKYGVVASGGRMGSFGVGGYTLGGGISVTRFDTL
jgi:FAD/FMN-containing dehydrogenase